MRFELPEKVALVTGGSRGIGYAIAQALTDAGAHVALVGRDGAKAREAAGSLGDSAARGFACDVTHAAQVESAVGDIER